MVDGRLEQPRPVEPGIEPGSQRHHPRPRLQPGTGRAPGPADATALQVCGQGRVRPDERLAPGAQLPRVPPGAALPGVGALVAEPRTGAFAGDAHDTYACLRDAVGGRGGAMTTRALPRGPAVRRGASD